jgi:protein gp37
MPIKTKIEWADYISNMVKARYTTEPYPLNGGHSVEKKGHACVKHSEGCANCWASVFNVRLGTGLEYTMPNMELVEMYLDEAELERARKFNPNPKSGFKNGRERAMIFPCDMTDLFGGWMKDEWLDVIFQMMIENDHVDWMILTKRVGRMSKYLVSRQRDLKAKSHLYLGCSVENQKRANERVFDLETVNFLGWNTSVSFEPALEAVDWRGWEFVNLMMCGGESGARAKVMPPSAARGARDFCVRYDIPFFFKQWGEYMPLSHMPLVTDKTTFKHRPIEVDGEMMVRVGKGLAGHVLDGREWREMP